MKILVINGKTVGTPQHTIDCPLGKVMEFVDDAPTIDHECQTIVPIEGYKVFRDKVVKQYKVLTNKPLGEYIEAKKAIQRKYKGALFSSVTTDSGRTWKADPILGLKGTAQTMYGKREAVLLLNPRSRSMTFYEEGKTTPTTLKLNARRTPDEAQREALFIEQKIEVIYREKNEAKAKLTKPQTG